MDDVSIHVVRKGIVVALRPAHGIFQAIDVLYGNRVVRVVLHYS